MRYSYWFWGGLLLFLFSLLFAGIGISDQGKQWKEYITDFWGPNMALVESVEKNESHSYLSFPSPSSEPQRKKVSMDVYYDLGCPHCTAFFNDTITPLLESESREKIELHILPYPLQNEGKSFEQSKWMVCVEQMHGDRGVHSLITQVQDEDTAEAISEYLEFDEEESIRLDECLQHPQTDELVLAIREHARSRGVRGVPTFFLEEEKFERNQSLESVLISIEKHWKHL